MPLSHEEKKLKILARLTNHNISGNREFVANSQRFAGVRQRLLDQSPIETAQSELIV
jgi:hypothetical protein